MAHNPIETFLHEADDLLLAIEHSALELAMHGGSHDVIHDLFRAFHTIKGSGAMCGMDAAAEFTHHVENLLGAVRDGCVQMRPELGGLVLRAKDHIRNLLLAESSGAPVPVAAGEPLIAEVNSMMSLDPPAAGAAEAAAEQEAASGERTWHIRFRPDPLMLAHGGKPQTVLNDLRELGPCEIEASVEDVPGLDAIEPDRCYLRWYIRLRTAADENAIRDVFIFVEDGAEIEITAEAGPETAEPQSNAAVAGPVAGPVAVADLAKRPAAARESTVRVPAERLDRLVNLVGEFVMNQSRLAQAAAQSGAPEFANPVQELERLVAELRDNVLGIRMLPIGTLFDRFRRLVHDLSAELGKETVLVTEGAETELDKSILDQLGEPLVHCLRNSVDHGVETPEAREAAGKPRRATVRLSAVHTGSDVVVKIEDDGKGIDRERVRAKAIERGLITADAVLSDRDVFNLILLPGFSTAAAITNVSGRGVGMDAVKRQIEALRGSVAISSEVGVGTTIAITLPLTLAIIDGLLVEISGDRFIVPMSAVQENVELTAADRSGRNGRNLIAVRGEQVPYIDLRRNFALGGEAPSIEKVVIVEREGDRVGLVVDRVLGTHQTVIQSLGRFYRTIEVVSGATIMGDGTVALILDVAAVVRYVEAHHHDVAEAA